MILLDDHKLDATKTQTLYVYCNLSSGTAISSDITNWLLSGGSQNGS